MEAIPLAFGAAGVEKADHITTAFTSDNLLRRLLSVLQDYRH